MCFLVYKLQFYLIFLNLFDSVGRDTGEKMWTLKIPKFKIILNLNEKLLCTRRNKLFVKNYSTFL